MLSNGKFLVSSGGFDAGTVVRYNSIGSLDTIFGMSGQQGALAAPGLAVQSDSRIVTAGSIVTQTLVSGNDTGFGLMRFNANGTTAGLWHARRRSDAVSRLPSGQRISARHPDER